MAVMTPTNGYDDALPTNGCDDALPTNGCDDALPTNGCDDALPTNGCDDPQAAVPITLTPPSNVMDTRGYLTTVTVCVVWHIYMCMHNALNREKHMYI